MLLLPNPEHYQQKIAPSSHPLFYGEKNICWSEKKEIDANGILLSRKTLHF
jgi:hypothetical protein